MSIRFIDLFRKACKVRLETFDKNTENVHIVVGTHTLMMIFLVYAVSVVPIEQKVYVSFHICKLLYDLKSFYLDSQ